MSERHWPDLIKILLAHGGIALLWFGGAALLAPHQTMATSHVLEVAGYVVLSAGVLCWFWGSATRTLARREEYYRSIVENDSQLICRFKPDTTLTFVNGAYARFFSATKQDLIGKRFIDLIPEEDRSPTLANITGLHAHNPLIANENRVFAPDGAIKWQRWTNVAMMDESGRVVEYQASGYDITEQKQAEDALRESEERLRAMADAARDAIVIADDRNRVVFWNRAAEDMFGLSAQDALGLCLPKTIVAEEDQTVFQDIFLELADRSDAKRAGARNREIMVRAADGRRFPADVSAAAFSFRERRHAIFILRDMTEYKDIQRQIMQMHKFESLDSLAGGIAHDFNNMLFPIIALTERTLQQLPHGDPARERLEKVLEAAFRARDLVGKVLAFSRKDDVVLQDVDLADTVRKALGLVRAALPSSIEVRETIDPETGRALVDPSQIQVVLMNLASNAADAMDGGPGMFEVGLERARLTPELLHALPTLDPSRAYARLKVKDTGSGISEDVLLRLFDPFFTTKPVGQGTGLGLPIVQRIVNRHNGTIQVHSREGAGTVFCIYLPLLD